VSYTESLDTSLKLVREHQLSPYKSVHT